jgi:hypothetical protein
LILGCLVDRGCRRNATLVSVPAHLLHTLGKLYHLVVRWLAKYGKSGVRAEDILGKANMATMLAAKLA